MSTAPAPPGHIPASRLAQLLDVHTRVVHRWITQGRFQAPRRVCGRWYVPLAEARPLLRGSPPPPPRIKETAP